MAGSFREGAGPGDAHAPPPTPTPPLSQYISLDSPAWGPDPKQQQQQHWRHPELRRALAADDQADELRRIRASVQDSTGKAKEKVRSLHDAIQKLDKFKNIVTRKRQRTADAGPDKLGSSSGALRMGAQNSSAVMSKRVRSSLADGRVEGRTSVPTRQGPLVSNEKNSPVEKEKSCTRMSATVSVLSEDKLRGLSTGGEGWEKKMKRKRSVGTMLGRGSDADRDVKSVGQHRPANEVRPRSSDGLAYRHGASAGALAGNKLDGTSQQNNIVSRIQSKTDVDYATQPNERRERHTGVDKERTTVKGNKANTSEDMQNGSLSPLPKAKACRAPRTSSLVMNSSSNFQRSTGGNDEWEEAAPYTNKASPLGGMTNRKRSTHSNASSPPIAWVGQRPQKMSRTRRANVVSPVSNFDEVLSEGSPLDTAARSTPIESGSVLTKNTPTTKMDSISSPAGLSESEGSVATESKSKEKAMHSGEVGNEGANAAHNAMGLIFSSNKNRIPLKEELEDGGVRRQGRSGRGTMHVKGCSSIPKEKLDTAETRKPIKGGRPGSEKNESKLGRPPMKKGSDRKASSWHSQALNCEPTDITGEPEDDQEELLAAVNAARSAIVGAYSGPFWKKMEPMLTFISSENLSFLKNQINLVEELEMSMSCMSDGEHDIIALSDYRRMQKMEEHSSQVLAPSNFSPPSQQSKTNGVGAKGSIGCFSPGDENHTVPQKLEADKWFNEMAPMAHRLLSALIIEDDLPDSNGVQRDILVEFPNSHNPYTINRYLENELQASAITSNFGLSVDFTHSNSTSMVHQSMCNGFTASSNFINSNSESSVHSEHLSDGVNFTVYPESGSLHDLMPQISRQCQNPVKDFPCSPYEYQYGQMSVEDKILIELQSIGICPETVPKLEDGEDEDINKMISELRKRLHDQVNQKKCRLHKLDKSIQDTKDLEERSLERHAMNKLVERAYRKLKGGRVGSSHKAGVSKSANKAAKQLALAFAKRTLARCQKFDETGKSCFSEPSLWSVLSAPLPSSDAKSTEGVERLKHQKLDRTPFDQGGTKWKKGERERDHNRDASAKGSGLKSGRHSSGGSGRSGERKNKTKPKQKLAQLSTSGNVLGRVVEPLSSPAVQEPPPEPPSERKTQHPTRNTSSNAAQRGTTDAALPVLPGLDDILDVPGGLDGQGNDISSWFTDGLDDSLQDIDLSGALEIPDDDLTQLGFI
ncbi:hypothetical protein SEVIR_3G071200v4 [Setaria viridis]|uniref:Uncharacterized protein n=1 Tax=Setaria viridis TaxID=4556 RepID=A0A4U6V6I2_SETVI|nr:uncharacterized protein LOC117848417 isoform X2 [Setaria viridis]TKW24768.1 hypothetical protein SEVIR_3G071200v2 [Setaria viridis]